MPTTPGLTSFGGSPHRARPTAARPHRAPDPATGPHLPPVAPDPPPWAPTLDARWLGPLTAAAVLASAVSAIVQQAGPGWWPLALPTLLASWLLAPFLAGWLLPSRRRRWAVCRALLIALAVTAGRWATLAVQAGDALRPALLDVLWPCLLVGVPVAMLMGSFGHAHRESTAVRTSVGTALLAAPFTYCALVLMLEAVDAPFEPGHSWSVAAGLLVGSVLTYGGSRLIRRVVGRAGPRQLTSRWHAKLVAGAVAVSITLLLVGALATMAWMLVQVLAL